MKTYPKSRNRSLRMAAPMLFCLLSFASSVDANTQVLNIASATGLVFAEDFEPGSHPIDGITPDVTTYNLATTSMQINTALWVRGAQGFNSSWNGLIDESENSGASFTDPGGTQAWAGRYGHTGITTAEGRIGGLTAGTTITVTFDAVIDGYTGGSAYEAHLLLFDEGASRTDTHASGNGSSGSHATLARATGTATGDYATYTLTYTVGDNVVANGAGGTSFLPGLLGKDVALRFRSKKWAVIDNIEVRVDGGGGNTAPAFTSNPTAGADATQGNAYTGTLAGAATDAEGNMLTYAKISGPAWLSVARDGTLSGTPGSGDAGANSFTVSVSDGTAPPVEASLNISVTPVVSFGLNAAADAFVRGGDFSGTNYGDTDTLVTKEDNNSGNSRQSYLRFDLASLPASISSAKIVLYPISLGSSARTRGVQLVQDDTWAEGAITHSTAPSSSGSGLATWQPVAGAAAEIDLTAAVQSELAGDKKLSLKIYATADTGSQGMAVFASREHANAEWRPRLVVTSTVSNTAPVFLSDPITGADAIQGAEYSGTLAGTATDAHNNPLTFAKISGPTWLRVASSGALSGTPSQSNLGTNSFTVSVSDGIAPPVEATLNITVNAASDETLVFADNFEPGSNTFGGITPEVTTYEQARTSQQINTALWVRGTQGLNGSWNGLIVETENGGASFTDPSGTQAWTGRYNNTGLTTAQGKIGGLTVGTTITVTFDAVIDGNAGGSAYEAHLLLFNEGALRTDTRAGGRGAHAILASATGTATGDYATYTLTYRVGDNVIANGAGGTSFLPGLRGKDIALRFRGNAVIDNVEVRVTGSGVNTPPAFASDPIAGADATVDIAYTGTLAGTATDIDADTLTYAKVSGPAWLTVAPDGTISGTPGSGDGGANSFTVSASDGTAAPVQATLSISVFFSLDAAADAFVRGGNYSGINYGGTNSLDTKNDSASNYNRRSYLRFDLASLPASIRHAKIVLYPASLGSTAGTRGLQLVQDDTWAENTITHSNAPAASGSGLATWQPVAGLAAEIDLTAAVQSELAGDRKLSLMIYDTENNGSQGAAAFASREHANAGWRPRLVVTLTGSNSAPAFTSNPIAGTAATQDAPYGGTLAGTATDAENDPLTFAKVSGPAWLSVAPDGTLSGTPRVADIGANSFTVSVSDGTAAAVQAVLDITVAPPNDRQTEIIVAAADAFVRDGSHADSNYGSSTQIATMDNYTGFKRIGYFRFDLASLPASITSAKLSLHCEDAGADAGPRAIMLVADDSWAEGSITYNNAPATSGEVLATWQPVEGSRAEIDLTPAIRNELAGDKLISLQIYATSNTGNGFAGFPSREHAAAGWRPRLTVVSGANSAPVFASDPIAGANATQDVPYSSTLAGSASDSHNDPLTFAKVSGPEWLNVAGNGAITGTPGNADVGANSFTVSVSDGNVSTEATLNITVLNVNDAPAFTSDPIAGAEAHENSSYSGTLAGAATDADNDPLTFAKVSGPAWLTVASDGALGGTPAQADVGANSFTVSVSDGTAPAVEAGLNITVTLPIITVPDLAGLTREAAETALVAAELGVGSVTFVSSSDVPAGIVISQGISQGTQVLQGTNVDFLVSRGDRTPPKLFSTVVPSIATNFLSHTWVKFDQPYKSPVIVATPIYPGPSWESVVPRITGVTEEGFYLYLNHTDSAPGLEFLDVSIVVVEEGVYTQELDGVKMEAVKFTSTVTDSAPVNWVGQQRSYQNSYTNPVVIGQVMGVNDQGWSVFWSRGENKVSPADSNHLWVGKHVGEDPDKSREDETIGYIVFEAGSGSIGGVGYHAGFDHSNSVRGIENEPPFTKELPTGLKSAAGAVASVSGMNGLEGGWPVLIDYLPDTRPFSTEKIALHIAEDTMADSERIHQGEAVHYLVVEYPPDVNLPEGGVLKLDHRDPVTAITGQLDLTDGKVMITGPVLTGGVDITLLTAAGGIEGWPEIVSPREGYSLSIRDGTDLVLEFRGGYDYYDMLDSLNPDLQHLLRPPIVAPQAPETLDASAAPLPPDGERIMNGLAPFISE